MACHMQESTKYVETEINYAGMNPSKNALVVIDVQNAFCDGSLSVLCQHTNENKKKCIDKMVNNIKNLVKSDKYDYIIYTQDAHPSGHISFASTHKKQPFEITKLSYGHQVLWPDHCVTNGEDKDEHGKMGIDFHPTIEKLIEKEFLSGEIGCVQLASSQYYSVITQCKKENKILPKMFTSSSYINLPLIMEKTNGQDKRSFIIWKGQDMYVDSYSAFKNAANVDTGLHKFLMEKGVKNISVCGLARDYCVWWSAVDASKYVDVNGQKIFNVEFIWNVSLPVETPWHIAKNYPDYKPNKESRKKHLRELVKYDNLCKVYSDLLDIDGENIEKNKWANIYLRSYGINVVTIDKTNGGMKKYFNELVSHFI